MKCEETAGQKEGAQKCLGMVTSCGVSEFNMFEMSVSVLKELVSLLQEFDVEICALTCEVRES